ncbi:DinB family protein, partial [Streptomyces umbrinus]
MHAKDILVDAYDRIREEVHAAVDGLSPGDLNTRIDDRTNSISWLVWHLTRVQDDHVADAFGLKQVWLSQDWPDRFALGLPGRDTGYGHTPRQVAKVQV